MRVNPDPHGVLGLHCAVRPEGSLFAMYYNFVRIH
jgi:hypothetical protein